MSAHTFPGRTCHSCLIALVIVAVGTIAHAQPASTPPSAPAAPAAVSAPMFAGLWIAAGGAFQNSHEEFGTRLALTRFFETAVVDGEYQTRGGPLLDVSAGLPLRRWGLGVQGGGSLFTRPHRGIIRGSIPHPLYFGQLRQSELEIGDLTHREVALRAELAWTQMLWTNWQVSVSAGPAVIHVQQRLVADVDTVETGYPFDAVNLVPATVDEAGWGIGGTAAVDVTWFVSGRVGLGVTGRFTRARVGLDRIKLSVGGASAIVGVRFLLH
jgi:hypothetical protein